MSDIPEAIGTAGEGGLFARAMSRKNGPGPGTDNSNGNGTTDTTGHFDESACLNCGTELIGSHCHACGQKAHLHRTLSAIGHDLMHGVLHLDGKLWHTLPLLAWHPGKLTRRYVDGERAFFVSPMAMFLFTVFLMFAIFQAIGFTTPTDLSGVVDQENFEVVLDEARSERDAALAALEATEADTAEREAAYARLETARSDLRGAEQANAILLGEDKADSGDGITFSETNLPLFKSLEKKWRQNPGLMLYKLQNNSYKFSWLLIPLSLPFVWLLFAWRREFKAYDHAVFVTYSLAFMSLLFIVLSLMGKIGIGAGWLLTIFATLVPLHIYRHLKGTYGLTRFATIWRLLVLLLAIVIVLTLFVQILVVLGAF